MVQPRHKTVSRSTLLHFLVVLLVSTACTASDVEEQATRTTRAALSLAAQRVLGFEDPVNDWYPVSRASNVCSQGAFSAVVSVSGWTEVTNSAGLSTLGEVADNATIDVRLPAWMPTWAEVRMIVKIPSQGEYYALLGSRSLADLAPGQFHMLQFPISSALKAKMARPYSDLTFTIALNVTRG